MKSSSYSSTVYYYSRYLKCLLKNVWLFTAIRSGDYYMFDEFDDELDSIVEKDNELSDDSLEDSDKTDTDHFVYKVNIILIYFSLNTL